MNIAWHGVYNPFMGYGSSCLELMKALEAEKIHACRVNEDPKAEKCKIGIAYSTAGQGALEMLPTPYRILYTMFECDKWPSTWVSACNCANQVWVPSQFCKDTLLKSGCDSPVNVIPLGFNPDDYYDTDPLCLRNSDVFTFGYSGSATLRKGYDLLLRAFQEEFQNDEPVRLRIHSSNILSTSVEDDSRIEYSCTEMTPSEQRTWYNQNDCFVMPSRGEGFALTSLESLACGCTVAVTNWSGQVDYLSDDCLRIGIDGLESCNGYHESQGKWARPSLASIKYCMRWAFENPEEIRQMGVKACERVHRDWTYAKSAEKMAAILKDVNPNEKVDIESIDVLVWMGDPRNIRTAAGGFTRGEPRELTAELSAAIDENDTRFRRERRYKRKGLVDSTHQ